MGGERGPVAAPGEATAMSNPEIVFVRNTFFEIRTGSRVLFIDPVFTRRRRGRRVLDELRPADIVLATSMTPWFEDVLDVLDDGDATFVATPRLCRMASRELGLERDRTLDLEPWERASEEGLRITAMPISGSIGMESAIDEGASLARDIGSIFPSPSRSLPLLGSTITLLDDGVRNVTRVVDGFGVIRRPRSLGRVGDLLGLDMGRLVGGRPGLGYLIEIDGYPSVLHLADGVHLTTEEEDLEEMAEVQRPDVAIVHVGGSDVEPLVRAVRILEPRTLLLYRSRDPYAAGRRERTLPMSSFVGAVEEDAPDTDVIHLRPGDAFVLEPASEAADAPDPRSLDGTAEE